MDYFRYFIYGLIQGITEFIPISSTGHLKIISLLFGLSDPGASVSAILQLGSVFAIIWFFRNDFKILTIFNQRFTYKSSYTIFILKSLSIGTLSILVFGFLIKVFLPNFTNSFLRSNLSIAFASILVALLMLFADRPRRAIFTLKRHSLFSSFFIGLGQALAIIPGVSRSGITISTSLLLGWKKQDAAKFSFLLGVPSISIAALVEILNLDSYQVLIKLGPLIFGLITTFIISIMSIQFFIRYISLNGLKIFAYYRLIFGTLIILSYFKF